MFPDCGAHALRPTSPGERLHLHARCSRGGAPGFPGLRLSRVVRPALPSFAGTAPKRIWNQVRTFARAGSGEAAGARPAGPASPARIPGDRIVLRGAATGAPLCAEQAFSPGLRLPGPPPPAPPPPADRPDPPAAAFPMQRSGQGFGLAICTPRLTAAPEGQCLRDLCLDSRPPRPPEQNRDICSP